MYFAAIDFETANQQRNSACAVGVAIVEGGAVVERISRFIRPPSRCFAPANVRVHGMTWEDVKDAPTFDQVFVEIVAAFQYSHVVAHNASFDVGVLRSSLDHYGIVYPEISYACTMSIARAKWPELKNHKLSTVADHVGIHFKHHQPGDDAFACASICLRACQETGANSVPDLMERLRLGMRNLCSEAYPPKRSNREAASSGLHDLEAENRVAGRNFVFTGTLQSMKRSEAKQRVVESGGKCFDSVTESTHFLVMGEQDLSRDREGEGSLKAMRAGQLIERGMSIQIIGERDFLEMLTI